MNLDRFSQPMPWEYLPRTIYYEENVCVWCGRPIPEGKEVCRRCEEVE